MDEARGILPYVKSLDDKYNVLYVNTPWSAMEHETLAKFPASAITADDAACFMWVDSYTVPKATKLLEQWGFNFHSVYQVLDVAKYAWMQKEPKTNQTTADDCIEQVSEGSAEQVSAGAREKAPEQAPDVAPEKAPDETPDQETQANDQAPKAPKRKAVNKSRAPPISPPHWWMADDHKMLTPSRPTTEQLWLAVKGDPSKLFTSVSLAFNVINRPDLGKKSRSKKPSNTNKWDTERPDAFLQNVTRHLTPEAKVLNVFASRINETVDCWGPAIPGGYLSSLKSNTGLVGAINKVLRALKKTQLQELCLKLPNVIDKDQEEKVDSITTWPQIEEAATSMAKNPGYNFKDDDGDVQAWVLHLVQWLSHNNMTNFTSLHAKKKKRKMTVKDPNRPRHGIASDSVVSKELSHFLGLQDGEMIARTRVVSLINKYISANGLKDPEKKNQIHLDDKLKTLLQPPADFGVITFFNICRLLKPHFPKAKAKTEGQHDAAAPVGGHIDKKTCQ